MEIPWAAKAQALAVRGGQERPGWEAGWVCGFRHFRNTYRYKLEVIYLIIIRVLYLDDRWNDMMDVLVPVGADDVRLPQAFAALDRWPRLVINQLACALLRGRACVQVCTNSEARGFGFYRACSACMITWIPSHVHAYMHACVYAMCVCVRVQPIYD